MLELLDDDEEEEEEEEEALLLWLLTTRSGSAAEVSEELDMDASAGLDVSFPCVSRLPRISQ